MIRFDTFRSDFDMKFDAEAHVVYNTKNDSSHHHL